MTPVDLNADLGELPGDAGWALDREMLACVSSASVACGGHAGDARRMQQIADLAQRLGVRLGAHLSYVDREHFGRREQELPAEQLTEQLTAQFRALAAVADPVYVKPHGALYHRVSRDPDQAAALIAAMRAVGAGGCLLGPPGSVALALAEQAGLQTAVEGFADRAYGDDGCLRPRGEAGAVIEDADAVAAQALQLAHSGRFRSLCLHGDTEGAVAIARRVRQLLDAEGVAIVAFA